MGKETFNELADNLAMNLKSEKDVSEMARMLTKIAIESALEIEMGEKSKGRRKNGNPRNGFTPKTLKTETAEIPLEIPRSDNLIGQNRNSMNMNGPGFTGDMFV